MQHLWTLKSIPISLSYPPSSSRVLTIISVGFGSIPPGIAVTDLGTKLFIYSLACQRTLPSYPYSATQRQCTDPAAEKPRELLVSCYRMHAVFPAFKLWILLRILVHCDCPSFPDCHSLGHLHWACYGSIPARSLLLTKQLRQDILHRLSSSLSNEPHFA